MLRLLLKVHWVSLRLREQVGIQCSIKSGEESFNLPQNAILKGGIASLNAYSQFFISYQNPTFQIQIILVWGGHQKLVGACNIDLRNWEQRCSHETQSYLQNSPDSKAKIKFDFMYMQSDVSYSDKKMFSLVQYECMSKTKKFREMQIRHQELKSQNTRLTSQMRNLLEKNSNLSLKQNQIDEEYQNNYQSHLDEIKRKDLQILQTHSNMELMKGQINRMKDMVEGYGQKTLIDKMNDIITPAQKNNLPSQK